MKSNLFKLDWKDFGRGILLAVLSAVATSLANLTTLTDFNLEQVISIAVIAGISYLAKNLSTDENDKVLGKF